MKIILKLVSILFFLFAGYHVKAQSRDCDVEIPESIFVIDGSHGSIHPGDVVCIKGSTKDFLLIRNVNGTAEQPVEFINNDGVVIINTDNYYGIKISHSSFIKLSGTGSEFVKYGFQVQRVAAGTGLSVGDLSTDVEIENVEIANTSIAGVYAKTDPTCSDFSSTRDKFTMYNFKFHDCYVHDVADEGLYIGSSKYSGQHLTGDCDTLVYPHVLIGTRVYNNIINNTGWDGIQVSSAEEDCKVYNNEIRNDSYAGHNGQMSGILIGGGTRADVYNNKIYDGKGDGIDIFGLGSMRVFNNLIVRAGRTYMPNDPVAFKHGIYLGKAVTQADEDNKIYNNTIVSPKSFGITYANDESNMGYLINNVVVNPGYTDAGDAAFYNINVDASQIEIENNYSNSNVEAAKFMDVITDNYDLKVNSPLIDKGKDMTSEGLVFDIDGRNRPFHNYTDMGAYECQDTTISVEEVDMKNSEMYPNPANNEVFFKISSGNPIVNLKVFSLNGSLVKQAGDVSSLNVSDLSNGIYRIMVTYKQNNKSFPLVIMHE